MEIERKYLIKKLPENLQSYPCRHIEQGYLLNHPTLRIRQIDDEYILTYKDNKNKETGSTSICNEEIERPLPKEAYEHLREKVDNNYVTKNRYLIPLEDSQCGRLTIELDIFEGKLKGLYFAEIEFPSVEAADTFTPPDWFGADVSLDKRYRNTYLSTLSDASSLI